MPQPVGGLRARYIRDSLWYRVYTGLIKLQWVHSTNRVHLPLTLLSGPLGRTTSIKPNTISLQDDRTESEDWELGSRLSEHRTTFYFDLFMESSPIGQHLGYDIRDILEGRMSSIGMDRPHVPLHSFTLADVMVTPDGGGGPVSLDLGDNNILNDAANDVTLGPDAVFATVGDIFSYAQVELVTVDRAIEDTSIEAASHWWAVRVQLNDYYGDETG